MSTDYQSHVQCPICSAFFKASNANIVRPPAWHKEFTYTRNTVGKPPRELCWGKSPHSRREWVVTSLHTLKSEWNLALAESPCRSGKPKSSNVQGRFSVWPCTEGIQKETAEQEKETWCGQRHRDKADETWAPLHCLPIEYTLTVELSTCTQIKCQGLKRLPDPNCCPPNSSSLWPPPIATCH